MERKITYTLSFIFLVFGLALLVNSQANITGAVIGVSTSPSAQGYFFGAVLILMSFVFFTVSIGKNPEKENNQTEK